MTNTFHYGDTLTINRDRHFMKMGGQWLRYQQNRFYPGNNGLLGVSITTAPSLARPSPTSCSTCSSRKGMGSNAGTWGHRQNRIGFFFQDDFKMRSNLTLNLGDALGVHVTGLRGPRPAVELRPLQRAATLCRSGWQQPGALRAVLQGLRAARRDSRGRRRCSRTGSSSAAGYGITQYMEGTGSNLRLPLNPPLSPRQTSVSTGHPAPARSRVASPMSSCAISHPD